MSENFNQVTLVTKKSNLKSFSFASKLASKFTFNDELENIDKKEEEIQQHKQQETSSSSSPLLSNIKVNKRKINENYENYFDDDDDAENRKLGKKVKYHENESEKKSNKENIAVLAIKDENISSNYINRNEKNSINSVANNFQKSNNDDVIKTRYDILKMKL